MEQSLVYLSGPISGLVYGDCTNWREYTSRAFPPHILGISPMRAKGYLSDVGTIDGSYEHPLSTGRGINTRNHFDTTRATAVLVNLLGAKKVSIGTVGEMAWAWDRRIPIVAAIEPDGSNPHEHPMLSEWIGFRLASLDEAIETTIAILSPHEKYMFDNLAQLHILQETNNLDLTPSALHQ